MSEQSDQDADLVNQLKAGDRDSLATFIENKRPQLLAFVQRTMSDGMQRKVDPVDILQEVTVTALNSLEDIDLSDRDPFNWLCQLVERRIIDAHRKHFGAQKRSADKEVGLFSPATASRQNGFIDILVASITSPSKAFSRDQREFKLLQALETLPEENRLAIKLRYVDGLPTKEIAAQLEKSDGAIRVMLTRSLSKLQEILNDDSKFFPPE